MSINLATKYAKNIAQKHTSESFLAGKAQAPYDLFGVKSLRIYNLISQELNDYNRSSTGSRYGTLAELQDAIQEISMTQDKSFKIAIDKGNNEEQFLVKEAGKVMKMQIREQVVPTSDKYVLATWAKKAGKALAYGAAVSKSNIIDMLADIEVQMSNSMTPVDGRYVCIKNTHIKHIRTAPEFQYTQAGSDMILKGVVGKVGTLNLIAMPDTWFPTKVEHVGFSSRAVGFPFKINDTRIITDSEDVSGAVLVGRFNYDAFVVGAICDDVVVCVANGYKTATLTATKGASTTALASTTNSGTVNIYYTLDGTDPRYSTTRTTYSAAFDNPDAGTVIKAYAELVASYYYQSDVLTHVCV